MLSLCKDSISLAIKMRKMVFLWQQGPFLQGAYFCNVAQSIVGFCMAALRWHQAKGVGVEMQTETQVETGGEQLLGQGGLAAKAVDRPALRRTECLVGGEQAVESPDAVDGQRKKILLGERHLGSKHFFLLSKRGAAQAVETTFAKGHNLRVGQQLL